jgi:putative phosphoesterase
MPATKDEKRIVVGVISDTHGPLTVEAASALRGVDHIVHAGDVVDVSVLSALRKIASLTAVRGNMDGYELSEKLARTAVLETGGVSIFVLHDLSKMDLDPVAAGFSIVIHGHTHKPEINRKNGVLYINPGSAGPSRIGRPATLARLIIERGVSAVEILDID